MPNFMICVSRETSHKSREKREKERKEENSRFGLRNGIPRKHFYTQNSFYEKNTRKCIPNSVRLRSGNHVKLDSHPCYQEPGRSRVALFLWLSSGVDLCEASIRQLGHQRFLVYWIDFRRTCPFFHVAQDSVDWHLNPDRKHVLLQ